MLKGHDPLSAIRYPLAVVLMATLAACSPKGEALYARAAASLESGAVGAAVIDLKNLAKDEPENARARALLAAALVEDGQIAAAEIEIKKARELGAPADMLLVPNCRVLVARGEFEQAVQQCRPEQASDAARTDLQVVTGRALLALERPAEARPYFEAALATRKDNLDALLGLGGAVYALEGLPAAKAVLDAAPEEIRKRSHYWMAVGGIYVQAKDYAGAEQAFEQAVKNLAKGADAVERLTALGALAEMQMRQNKVKEAEATTQQLVKAAPNNPMVKQLRAQVAAASGDYDQARTLLEEAVAAMPDNTRARVLLGMINLEQGNLGQAEMHFSTALASQPNDVRVQRLLAQTRARLTSPEQSLESMKGALDAEDADPSLLSMAARMSLASGDRRQAMTYLTEAAAHSAQDGDPQVTLEIATGYLMAGDIDRAVALLEKVPDSGSEGAAAGIQREYLLILALLRKGDSARAVVEAEALLQRSPNDVVVRNLVAGVYIAVGRQKEAREQFEAALKLKANDERTLVNLARLDLMQGDAANAQARFQKVLEAEPKSLTAMVGMAVAASTRGEAAEAEKWLQRASSENPESLEAQVALAQFYLGARSPEKALAAMDAAAKKWPDSATVFNMRGLALLMKGDSPAAIASLERAVSLEPKSSGFVLNLARAHMQNRDADGALRVLDAALKATPDLLPALALAGAVSLQAGKIERATGYVERLRSAAPESPVTAGLEGDLAMRQKRYNDALQSYREAGAQGKTRELVLSEFRAASLAGADKPEAVLEDWVAKNRGDAAVVAVLADVRQRRGDKAGATRLYEQALETAPNDPIVLNNLAMLYSAAGDPRAPGLAERAYKAAPKAPAIADTYGWLLFKQGKADEALPLLREALRGLPDNAEVQYHLAAVLAKQGEKAEALTLVKKAVNGQLPPETKVEARQLLDQLSR